MKIGFEIYVFIDMGYNLLYMNRNEKVYVQVPIAKTNTIDLGYDRSF